jgi:hypothetical protein
VIDMVLRRRVHARSNRLSTGAAATLIAVAAIAAVAPDASAATRPGDPLSNLVDSAGHWAPALGATIRPGVVTDTKGAQCTSNFLFTDAARNVYLGQAAHCSGTGEATDTNGCTAKSLALGTPVNILGSGVTGTLAYNSWLLMQRNGEKDENACAFNDLALIRIPAAALDKANPSIPVFGGPTGLNTTGTQAGDSVESYGNSPLRQGIDLLSPKSGTSLGDVGNGWSHTVYTFTPGIPGDSGSAFLDSQGRALGDLSTLALAPTPLSNQVSDLAHELRYAAAHSGIKGLRLVAGTEPFQGGAH